MPALLQNFLVALGLERWVHRKSAAGLVAAIVSIDREDLSVARIDDSDEEEILGQLKAVLKLHADAEFNGTDWSVSHIKWFFFGRDAKALEKALLDALRAEPRCKGALLRVTRSGVAGPWRETRI